MLRYNTSKILTNNDLTNYAVKVLGFPKRRYLEIVVDFFNKPAALLYRFGGKDKMMFLDSNQKDKIEKLVNASGRKRKEILKNLEISEKTNNKTNKKITSIQAKKLYDSFSKIDLDYLVSGAQNTMFKKAIDERVKGIGQFKYLGFEYTFYRNKKGNLVLFYNLYFIIDSSLHISKGKKKRYKYLLGIKFPHLDNLKTYKKLKNVPVQIFSSDPSFNFYFAYALNSVKSVLLDHPIFVKHLEKALKRKPKIRNKDLKKELTKHLYKVIEFLYKYSPMDYLEEDHLIDIRKLKIPNKLPK